MDEITITVHPFQMGTDKEAALKPLEEASEARSEWQNYMRHVDMLGYDAGSSFVLLDLADEIADCIQACVNLAARYDIDLPAAMERCEERNRARGRYQQDDVQEAPEISDGARKILERMMAASEYASAMRGVTNRGNTNAD